MNNTRNYGLDVMRAVAIALVVLSHFSVKSMDILGLFGVELFFVLSGYLIGGILLKQIKARDVFEVRDLLSFFQRRWFRTLPNYFLFLMVYSVIGYIMPRMFPSPVHLWKFMLFLQNFTSPPPLFYMISWSLAVEEWFYLIFPSLFFFLYKLSRLKQRSFVAAAMIITVLPLCARLLYHPDGNWNFNIRMVVIYRLDALMYGVLLAYIHREHDGVWEKMGVLFLPGLAALAGNFFILRHVFPIGNPAIPLAVAFSEIPLFCACLIPFLDRLPSPALSGRVLVENISKWSYSIYLSHYAILFVFYGFAEQFSQSVGAKLFVKVSALLTSVLASAIIYRYYEKPIMDFGRGLSTPGKDLHVSKANSILNPPDIKNKIR